MDQDNPIGGGNTGTAPGSIPIVQPAGTPPPAGQSDANSGTSPSTPAPSSTPNSGTFVKTPEFQSALDSEIGRIRDNMRKEFEKKEADKVAAAQGKFEDLYNAEKVRADALDTNLKSSSDLTKSLAKAMNSTIDSQISDWPASLKKLDPGSDNLEARMKWVETSKDLADELLSSQRPPAPEMGRQGNSAVGNRTNDPNLNPGTVAQTYLNQLYGPRTGVAAPRTPGLSGVTTGPNEGA